MGEVKKSGRDKQKMIMIVFVVCFILSLLISIAVSKNQAKREVERESATQNVSTTLPEEELTDVSEVTNESGENNTLIPATFKKAINSRTIEVVQGSKTLNVVLIGVDAKPDNEKEAVAFLQETLKPDTRVWLLYDEADMDEEGNHLCYVWLTNDVSFSAFTDYWAAYDGKMLQITLLQSGHYTTYEEYPNSRYETLFKNALGGAKSVE